MNESEVFHNLALFDSVLPQTQPDGWLEVADGRIQRSGFGPPPLPEGKEGIEASFLIEVEDASKLQECKENLQLISPEVKISFIDNTQL